MFFAQIFPGERRRAALFRAFGQELDESSVFGRLPSDVETAHGSGASQVPTFSPTRIHLKSLTPSFLCGTNYGQ